MYQPSLRVEIERISKELLNLRDSSVDDKNIFEMLASLQTNQRLMIERLERIEQRLSSPCSCHSVTPDLLG